VFDTLYKKLSIVLFGLVCLIGFFLVLFVRYTTELYQQELNQSLNAALADQIVAQEWLLENGRINQDALGRIFHNMMVINPSIELYLLDAEGGILAYSAPKGKVKRSSVDLDVVHRFIDGVPNYPLPGNDPRSMGKQKVFSAARIPAEGEEGPLEGYLYVILGGEAYDSVTEMIQGSYIIRLSLIGLGAGLLIAFLGGALLFALLTRRLSRLASLIGAYSENNTGAEAGMRYRPQRRGRDEIDRLGEAFNVMADRIEQQFDALKQNDVKRRELIAGVSHDLRTPLTVLHGYLETLLLKEADLSLEERQNFIGIAIRNSEHMITLVNDLFELAKLDSVNPMLTVEPFSIEEVIQDIVQQFELTAKEKGLVIATDLGGGDMPYAYGDIRLIHRVLNNLLDNAVRYTQEGGRITLSVSPGEQRIGVTIADSGCGIPKEELPFIFDRFYRSKTSHGERGQHSGLGLAIVKRILALHDSTIDVESDTTFGTTFFFNLRTDPLL